MTPHYADELLTLFHGDCITVMRELPEASVDAVVTDPPGAVSFMGKKWDSDKGGRTEWVAWMTEVMAECYRVLKPGGYAVVWSLPRTCHWTAWAMEDAGFLIRDQLAHIFAQGFPKGRTQLKPAREDWWLARKPGPLQPLGIDAGRIGLGTGEAVDGREGEPTADTRYGDKVAAKPGRRIIRRTAQPADVGTLSQGPRPVGEIASANPAGRWPSNVLLDADSAALFDQPNPEVVGSGAVQDSRRWTDYGPGGEVPNTAVGEWGNIGNRHGESYGDTGGYSRFYLIPKADRRDREPVLRDEALRLHRERGECDKLPAWRRPDLSPSEQTDSTSPAAATSGEPYTDASDSGTSSPGNQPTARSPRATRSTISMATSRTTDSPISSSSIPSAISASTPAASSAMGNGGSPATSAESSSLWGIETGTSPERDGPTTDAAGPATFARWSRRNSCGDCGKPLPRVGTHPTTKPVDLMRHLVRLVTPPQGVVLDCFLGSGSTALAANAEGFRCIGIEQSAEYLDIAMARLLHHEIGLGLEVAAPTRKRTLGEGTWPHGRSYSPNTVYGPLKKDDEVPA